MRIRYLDFPGDVPAILSFIPELYGTNFPGFVASAEFLARKRAQLKESTRDPGQMVLVAEDEAGVCGFIWLVIEVEHTGRRRGEVSAIYVASRCRGQGVGRRLMAEGEAYLLSYGCDSVHLMVTVSNERASGLYKSLGYEVTRHHMEKPLRRGK